MDVVLRDHRHVEVHDVPESLDVDAASGNVRRHEHAEFARLEPGQGFRALSLGAVAVDPLGCDPTPGEQLAQPVRTVLGTGEHESVVDTPALQEIHQERAFERARNGIERLGHGRGGFRLELQGDLYGIAQDLPGQGFDRRRHRRAEEERLLRLGDVPEHPSDVRQKTHVEHPVRFVQDQILESGERCVSLLEVIQQASGCRDDHIRTLPERGLLRPHAHTPVNGGRFDAGEPGEVAKVFQDLKGQLPRRRQHERPRRPARQVDDAVKNGE